jgi:hypothetical protein
MAEIRISREQITRQLSQEILSSDDAGSNAKYYT